MTIQMNRNLVVRGETKTRFYFFQTSAFNVAISDANLAKNQILLLMVAALKDDPSSGYSLRFTNPVFEGVYVLNVARKPAALQYCFCLTDTKRSCCCMPGPSIYPFLHQYPKHDANRSLAVPRKIMCIGSLKQFLTSNPGMSSQGLSNCEVRRYSI